MQCQDTVSVLGETRSAEIPGGEGTVNAVDVAATYWDPNLRFFSTGNRQRFSYLLGCITPHKNIVAGSALHTVTLTPESSCGTCVYK